MDLEKIFIKNCCPTKCGGQAVMEGVMMRGKDREAITVRVPDGRMRIKITSLSASPWWKKVPILRGVCAFVSSLVSGTKTLLWSADVLEKAEENAATGTENTGEKNLSGAEASESVSVPGGVETGSDDSGSVAKIDSDAASAETNRKNNAEKPGEDDLPAWLIKLFGKDGAWNAMLYGSVVLSLAITVVFFMLLPTALVNVLSGITENVILLNLAEALVRIFIFLIYLIAIQKMEDIRRVFQYHGAEHKTIHCYENGLELTPANARTFTTLHPRCGTSFLVFTILISLLVHAFFGWPTLWLRVLTRLGSLPIIAGLSYELLQWAGRSDNAIVKYLSVPGLLTQKITTKEPDDSMLECAICSLKAVTDEAAPKEFDGYVTLAGEYLPLD